MFKLENDPVCDVVAEKLKKLGVEAVFFDLDDTLIYTSEIFIQCMQEYAEIVAGKTGVGVDKIMESLQSINDEEYKKMGVNPKRWAVVVEKLAKEFEGSESEIVENLDMLMRIYSIVPRMREGAKVVLEVLKQAKVKMVLVTHANVEWTNFKLDSLGLWDYFETVVIVDENGHKKSIDWKRGMDEMEIAPERCLVVGDSLSGDIKPGNELGSRTIYMPSPWAVYREGEVPERTVVINEIAEFLAALDRLH